MINALMQYVHIGMDAVIELLQPIWDGAALPDPGVLHVVDLDVGFGDFSRGCVRVDAEKRRPLPLHWLGP